MQIRNAIYISQIHLRMTKIDQKNVHNNGPIHLGGRTVKEENVWYFWVLQFFD